MEEGLTGKAELILGGSVRVPEGVRLPQPTPGEPPCPNTAALEFDGYRVRVATSQSEGEYSLRVEGKKKMSIVKGDRVVAPDISLGVPNRGCDRQLVIDMSGGITPEEVALIAERTASRRKVKMISFSARFIGDMDDAIDRIARSIEAVKWLSPNGAIGVEAWLTSVDQVSRLKKAGVNEIKIDLGCVRRDVFEKVYPDRDYDAVLDLLRKSVGVFRKGKLACDVYYGLGESDQDIDILLEKICRMGVIPIIRTPRPDDMGRIENAGMDVEAPSVLRSVFLCGLEKSAMRRHGVDPSTFRTMCPSCGACILVPFKDVRCRTPFLWRAPAARTTCTCCPVSAPRISDTASDPPSGDPPQEAA